MSDRDAVLAVLDELAQAWNAGDATRYAAAFTDDATYTTFFGHTSFGRGEIEAGHRRLFEGPLRGSTMGAGDGMEPSVRFPRPDVALVLVGGTSVLAGQEPDPARASVVSFVLVRDDGRWRVAAFQNTRRSPVPAG
ncbi:SgcJ/EcaC family oxidoreductase [Amycolatopsis suaedae]|uniref:SgcJ/EcaC family oxidoreductase n=1 Tax=Amycolatopsis suaedae TaxID=2510978 RepID=A0A4Q7IZB3_9PSEU|nr:SgcJ/EcaC family oxidoreductase [Amycolatopsis suaedae]RZQ60381.1 SgcJ/EcaC family oxidoreductase [Amycolatopsis suaedae]